jgi:hypothetical protein
MGFFVMRIMKISGIFLAASLVVGCVAPAQFNLTYTEPTPTPIRNTITVNEDFEKTWKKLVSEMSKSFYVINNIDKESNLINLSFSITDNIGDYVDCGNSRRTFSLKDIRENVSYRVADKSESYASSTTHRAPPNTTYYRQFRSPKLEGRTNVYVAAENGKTEVRVNTRYIWTLKNRAQEYMYMPLYNSHNPVGGIETSPTIDPISFNTKTSGSGAEVTCFATGKFENEILDIVR